MSQVDAGRAGRAGRSPKTDPDAAAVAHDLPPEITEPSEISGGYSARHSAGYSAVYSADQAAIAFGIPRIAPVLVQRFGNQPGGRAGRPRAVADFPAEVEDFTESLTADEREAAFPGNGGHGDHGNLERAEQKEPREVDREVEREVEPVLGEPVTAALRMPSHHARPVRAEWEEGPRTPLTERLVVPISPNQPLTDNARKTALRQTAVLPALGRYPGETATTTVTLPPGASSGAFAFVAAPDSAGVNPMRLTRWLLLGAGATLALLLAGLGGRALTLADLGSAAARGPAMPARAPAPYRERLLEQATAALRDGRREQAVGLLLRYQASEPVGSADRTVEIMLRVLKKDLGTPSH